MNAHLEDALDSRCSWFPGPALSGRPGMTILPFLPASGARELSLAQHTVEGPDGVVGAGFLLGFGLR
jgi:hypothetical protein